MRFIFNKLRGDDPVVRLWEEIDSNEQLSLLQGIRLDPDEEPAVGIPEGPSPVVVTTKRIAWRSGNTLHDVSLGDVVAVNVPEFMEVSKLDLRRLWLVTRSGEEFLLETEPGTPFFVLWNFLLRVIEQPKPVAG